MGDDKLTAVRLTGADRHILILAPHQDDECLQTAGVIRAAVLAGNTVDVCFATNGDYAGEQTAAVRAAESRQVLSILGVPAERILFLGYPDTGMPYEESFLRRLYEGRSGLRSRWGREKTWTPEGRDFRFLRSGYHSAYTADSFRRDLAELFALLRPDEVYVSAPGDRHGDHDALGRLTAEAVSAYAGHAELYYYLVHADEGDWWPNRRGSVFSVPAPPFPGKMERRRLPRGFSAGDKAALIKRYVSQDPAAYGGYLLAFAKEDELLFRAPAPQARLACPCPADSGGFTQDV